MAPTVKKISKKSPSMSPNFKKRNFKAKPEAEWEFQKKSSALLIKRKLLNSKLFQSQTKLNSSFKISSDIPFFSKILIIRMNKH
jgi:hypothetical protein